MTTDDVYQFFGSGWKASCAIGIVKQTFSNWIERGFIPMKQQLQIEKITKGKLIAREEDAKKPDPKKALESDSHYLPNFRYYDKKHGMCNVESIHFRKGKPPKITYVVKRNNIEKFTSFSVENLMQASDLVDCEGKTLYEGDICFLLGKRRKLIFKNMSFISALENKATQGYFKFKIIGNIFE